MPRHPWPTSRRTVLALALALGASLSVSACGESQQEKAAKARQAIVVPATVRALPTNTPEPTKTPEPTEAVAVVGPGGGVTVTGRARLPAEKSAPVVQIARVEPHASEVGTLADMVPEFSLTADGHGVFQAIQGPSATDWYQTALTEEQTQRFVQLLVDQIGVLRLAKEHPAKAVDLGLDANGNPRGPAAVGVIYVRTATDQGRLVLTQADLANSSDPAMQRLASLLIALENWKAGVRTEIPPEAAPIVAENLGFWTDLRQPWTPERLIAFGTKAPAGAPGVAVADWPLAVDPGTLFQVEPGETPDFAVFSGSDVAALLDAQIKAGLDPDQPMWRMPGKDELYVIGLRASPPGSNHIWVEHEEGAAPVGGTPGASGSPGAPTAVPGSAAGRPTVPPTATATP